MTRFSLVATLTLALLPTIALGAPKGDARPHLENAAKAHEAGEFDKALVELQAAYAIDPQPELLYAIGQVYAKLGKCQEAVDHYERFLAVDKDPETAKVIRQAIEACKAAEPPPPPPPPVVEEPPPPPPPPPPVAAPIARRSRWYADWLGDALVIGGVVSTGVGLGLYVSARSTLDDAEGASSLARYDELVGDAHDKRLMSVVLVGGGVALVTAGIMRLALRNRGEVQPATVGVIPARGGGLVSWQGRF